MIDLTGLKTQIEHGAESDLYRGVLALKPGIPVPPEFSETFMLIARSIVDLYPGRVEAIFLSPYDARVIAIDFCEHPATTRADVIRILATITGKEK